MDPTTPNLAGGTTPATPAPVRIETKTAVTAGSEKTRTATSTSTTATEQEAALQRDPRSLQYQVDGNRVITTIIDENDKTVVVQIPDAEMIRIAKAIDRMQGFLVKSSA